MNDQTSPGQDQAKPKRKRCKNCGKLFPKTRHNREFCSDRCRKEFHRHAGAFAPLKAACEKYIDQRLAEARAESRAAHAETARLIRRAEELIEGLKDAASIARSERRQAKEATAALRAATVQNQAAALGLAKAFTEAAEQKRPTTTTPTPTPTEGDIVRP